MIRAALRILLSAVLAFVGGWLASSASANALAAAHAHAHAYNTPIYDGGPTTPPPGVDRRPTASM
jgi:hypothetical protein